MSFNVWEKKNADGKGSGVHDFTSLMGSDKKRLMRDLPSKLHGVIRPNHSESVIKIWKVMYERGVKIRRPESKHLIDSLILGLWYDLSYHE